MKSLVESHGSCIAYLSSFSQGPGTLVLHVGPWGLLRSWILELRSWILLGSCILGWKSVVPLSMLNMRELNSDNIIRISEISTYRILEISVQSFKLCPPPSPAPPSPLVTCSICLNIFQLSFLVFQSSNLCR